MNEDLLPFIAVRVIYDDGDQTITQIRLSFEDAVKYYLNKYWTYWSGEGEKKHKCIKVEPIMIYRVQNQYGIRDYHSLSEARSHMKPNETLQLIASDGLTILSERGYRNVRPSWVKQTLIKYGYEEIY